MTLTTPPFRVLVVTSHAMRPAKKPAMEPPMHPHLFALLQVTQSAMGTTAEPRITPMKVYSQPMLNDFGLATGDGEISAEQTHLTPM